MLSYMQRSLNIITLSFALSLGLAMVPSFPAGVRASSQGSAIAQGVNFKPPDVTAPGNRQGGAHRGSGTCPADLSITPLIPASNIGLTVQQSPTFFVYVPQVSSPVEFTLLSENEVDLVYETSFQANNGGIISVSLPENTPTPLEVGKRYVWAVSVICDPNDRSADVVAKGWVQRVKPEPGMLSQLQQKHELRDRLRIYAENGLWYETLSALAELRRQAPGDTGLKADWTQLLTSQGLDTVVAQPLVMPQFGKDQ